MENENNKQNVDIAVIKEDVKHIKEALDRQIENYNGKFRMVDDRITTGHAELKSLIDNHCGRIRATEKAIVLLEPIKKMYDKLAFASLGIMITLGLAVIGLAYTLLEKIKH